LANQVAASQPASAELFAYPKNGQTAEMQAKDRFECHSWAAGQTGFDPSASGVALAPTPNGAAAPAAAAPPPSAAPPSAAVSPAKRQDYLRAQSACLEGRGYSVK
jgi:hypothetical protein